MYNHHMPATTYQIRLCKDCGLRYPLAEGQAFGIRCPMCMGDTRLILSRALDFEPIRDRPESFHQEEIQDKKNKSGRSINKIAVLLDNIRSAWNVGSILRSADGFGFGHAYLCGITPTPDGPARESVIKTALGAEDSVTWSHHQDAVKLVSELKKERWQIWALEEDPKATSISQFSPPHLKQQIMLIVGSEVTGVDPELLDLADAILYIPMRGEKRSFNVAMAFSIAAYQLQK